MKKYIAYVTYENDQVMRINDMMAKLDLGEQRLCTRERFEVVAKKDQSPKYVKEKIKEAFTEAGGRVSGIELMLEVGNDNGEV